MLIWFEIVLFVILAGPGLFVITHGHSLFGPTAIPHDQLAKMYNKLLALHVVEPTPPIHNEVKEDDECYPTLVFYGNIVIIFLFAFMSIMITVDGIKKPIPYESADNYTSETKCPIDGSSLVLICCHVTEEDEPPVLLTRTQPVVPEDSGWQCLCGNEHEAADALIVCVDDVVRFCPQLEIFKDEPFPCTFSFDPVSKTFQKQQVS